MATIVIRDLPDDLHERLKAQAKRNHRSLNKETVAPYLKTKTRFEGTSTAVTALG